MPGQALQLTNGQTWKIVDDSTAAYRLNNPKVTIEPGMLGSYFMKIDGVAQTPRVERVR